MLQTASTTAEMLRVAPATECAEETREQVISLSRQLRSLGVEPKVRVFPCGTSAGGIALRIRVRELIAAPDQLNGWLDDIRRILESGVRLTLSLDDLGLDDISIDCLEHFCKQVQEALPDGGLPKQQLGLCIAAADIADRKSVV